MYEITANRAWNRLYIRLDGFIDDVALRQAVSEILTKIDSLRPGIDFITDISGFKPASPEGAKEIRRAMQYAQARGVRHIMRVIGPKNGPSVISRIQFARLASETGTPGVIEEVTSRAEAERRLDVLNMEARWRS